MKIEITKNVSIKETIDVEFPYYFKNDLMNDYGRSIIYGKMTEMYEFSILETIDYNGKITYEIEKDKVDFCYLDAKYKSSELEYLGAKIMATKFLESF